jgi:hypothetical protein
MSVRTKSWSLLVQNHFYKLVMWSEFWWWETDLPGTPLIMSLLQINILWFGIYRIKLDTEQQLKLVLFCLECGLKLIFLFQSMRVFVASSYFFFLNKKWQKMRKNKFISSSFTYASFYEYMKFLCHKHR